MLLVAAAVAEAMLIQGLVNWYVVGPVKEWMREGRNGNAAAVEGGVEE